MTQTTPGIKRHQKHRAQLLGFVPLGILSLRLQTVSVVAGFYGCLVFLLQVCPTLHELCGTGYRMFQALVLLLYRHDSVT